MVAAGILDQPGACRCPAIDDCYPHHRAPPGDVDLEPAALSAGGMQDRVCRQFRRDQDDVVAGRVLRQQRLQPAPQRAELSLLAEEGPAQPKVRPGRWPQRRVRRWHSGCHASTMISAISKIKAAFMSKRERCKHVIGWHYGS